MKSLYCLVGVSVCAWIIVEGAEAKLYQQELSRTLLKKGKQPLHVEMITELLIKNKRTSLKLKIADKNLTLCTWQRHMWHRDYDLHLNEEK